MALLGNYALFLKCPVTNIGGDGTSGITGLRSNFGTAGVSRSRFYGENWVQGTADRYGLPSGYVAPYSWVLPPKAGGMGSNVGLTLTASNTANLAAGKNLEALIEAGADINSASLALVVSMIATIEAGGLITNANLVAYINMAASLAASGDLTGSLRAVGHLISEINATATLSPQMNATANMEADITSETPLSPNALAAAVWNSLAADFNVSGTMGQKLNGAGSAGDPWTTDLSSYTTAGTAGALMKKASKPKISL